MMSPEDYANTRLRELVALLKKEYDVQGIESTVLSAAIIVLRKEIRRLETQRGQLLADIRSLS